MSMLSNLEPPQDILNLLLKQLKEGVCVFDPEGRVIFVNGAAENILGWVEDEFLGMQVGEFIEEISPSHGFLSEQLHQGTSVQDDEACVTGKNGNPLWLSYTLTPVKQTQEVLGLVLTFRDITEKKKAEQELQRQEKLFHSLADCAIPFMWFFSRTGEIGYMNQSNLDFFGLSFEEAMQVTGGSVGTFEETDFGARVHPDDIPGMLEAFQNILALKTPFTVEARHLRVDGQYRWLLLSGAPVITQDGEFLGFVGSNVDINDLKEAQEGLAQYAKRLEQSNKELEHFATIASHDLQEPLRKILLFTDHLKKVGGASLIESGTDDLKRIQSAAGRMQRLINDLLDLSRITRRGSPFETVDLHFLMKEVITELSYFYEDTKNQVELDGDMVIDADYNQIHQMMTQLLDNALKFHQADKPSSIKVHIQAAEENCCQITVSDDGLGMKPEQLSRIFDPFVRLHHGTEYPGTGIGLALVKKIVERHNGSITVSSMPEAGSTFTVLLPVLQTQKA